MLDPGHCLQAMSRMMSGTLTLWTGPTRLLLFQRVKLFCPLNKNKVRFLMVIYFISLFWNIITLLKWLYGVLTQILSSCVFLTFLTFRFFKVKIKNLGKLTEQHFAFQVWWDHAQTECDLIAKLNICHVIHIGIIDFVFDKEI